MRSTRRASRVAPSGATGRCRRAAAERQPPARAHRRRARTGAGGRPWSVDASLAPARRRPCGRPFPFPSLPSSSSWPARAGASRTNSWVWPRAVLPVSCTERARAGGYALLRSPPGADQKRQRAHALGGAEQADAGPVAREDADADDARPLVDLAPPAPAGSSIARPWTSRMWPPLSVTTPSRSTGRPPSAREPARDLRRRHRDHLDRQRKAAEPLDPLRVVGDADEALGQVGDDLLARQRRAAALDHAAGAVDLVGAVDVDRQRLDLARRRAPRMPMRAQPRACSPRCSTPRRRCAPACVASASMKQLTVEPVPTPMIAAGLDVGERRFGRPGASARPASSPPRRLGRAARSPSPTMSLGDRPRRRTARR